jgi:two-component system, cell cycle sensor histidine kinase and response regulator CckA
MQLSILNDNASSALKDKTVLLIDDEKLVIEIGELMLRRLGHKVFKANSGFEAVKIFEEYQSQIDLVIMDMYMPEMNGQELTDKLRKIDQKIKVLLSSGGLADLEEREILDRGFDGFIRKPYSIDSLSEEMAKILN